MEIITLVLRRLDRNLSSFNISLLGIVIIAGKQIYITNHLFRGVSFALVMLILTYLIPNEIISKVQGYILPHRRRADVQHPRWRIFLSIFVGLLVAVGFILIERVIISTQLHKLDRISSFITQKMWFFLGMASEREYREKRKKRKKNKK